MKFLDLTELEENVNAELDDNPALEVSSTEDALDNPHDRDTDDRSRDDYGSTDSKAEGRDGDDDNGTDIVSDEFDRQNEREERESALNAALERIGEGDDDMPTASYQYGGNNESADYEEMVYGNTTSFYDRLKEQMGELELTETDRDIMEYVIGSLDSDGLLRKDSERRGESRWMSAVWTKRKAISGSFWSCLWAGRRADDSPPAVR